MADLKRFLVGLGLGLVACAAVAEDAPWVIGLPQLHRLDLMPAFKRSIEVGNVSSYDRTGGNDDGFSGKYSFIRKEGDNLVIADLKGPGCIYRIHTPTPPDDIVEFYFDGEATPRIRMPFRQMFEGKQAPFVKPLVDGAGGGYYSYVPICYRKSCKILVRAKTFQFYDLNYATFPANAPIQTFDPKVTASDKHNIEIATAVLNGGRASDLTSHNMPAGSTLKTYSVDSSLAPSKSVTLLDTHQGGRIGSIRLEPALALAGKDRDILLRVTWDNEKGPSFICPAGDFFGYAWGKPATGDCLVGTSGNVDYCNFPMPFDRAAKIELVSVRKGGPSVKVHSDIVVGSTPRRSYEGKFYAVWRRENPTTEGKPFTFIDAKGRGHIVGLALQAQGKESGNTTFFEGDDQTTIDGNVVINGTGSEDFFNGGWYDVPDRWDRPLAKPLSGCMLYQKPMGRSGAYRFFIGDAYSYQKSILQTIEHAPERNQHIADYCAVTYLYSEKRPTPSSAIPDLATRRVTDPSKIEFSADWTLPINSFSFKDATLSRTSVPSGNGQTRCLSFRSQGEDWFGPAFLSVTCDLPAAVRYRVTIDVVKGPEQGKIQLFRDETPIGEPIDLYSATPSAANGISVGDYMAVEGENRLMFKVVGKNPASKSFGFDLVHIVFKM